MHVLLLQLGERRRRDEAIFGVTGGVAFSLPSIRPYILDVNSGGNRERERESREQGAKRKTWPCPSSPLRSTKRCVMT